MLRVYLTDGQESVTLIDHWSTRRFPVHPTPHPRHDSVIRHSVLTLAAGLCLAAAVAVWALLPGSFDDPSVRVLLSGLAAALCMLGGLAGATTLRLNSPERRAGEVTIGLSQLT